MGQHGIITDPIEREAILGLWAIPGIGAVSLREVEKAVGGFRAIADVPVRDWLDKAPLRDVPREWLRSADTLLKLAQMVRDCVQGHERIAFPGEAAYPAPLLDIEDPPAVLFYVGEPGAPRKRVAVVGSRNAGPDIRELSRDLAAGLASYGVGVISGAARGVDSWSHEGALKGKGETWAFVASSLNQLDPKQRVICRQIRDGGGMIFSEYPPGTRAQKEYFPRRNRLISGSADAVIIVRAAEASGSLYTAEHALKQGRPLFAVPADASCVEARGGNLLLRRGQARAVQTAEDVAAQLELKPLRRAEAPPPGRPLSRLGLSDPALKAYSALNGKPQVFEKVLGTVRMDPAVLTSALCELELEGLVVQHPGKRYERA